MFTLPHPLERLRVRGEAMTACIRCEGKIDPILAALRARSGG